MSEKTATVTALDFVFFRHEQNLGVRGLGKFSIRLVHSSGLVARFTIEDANT